MQPWSFQWCHVNEIVWNWLARYLPKPQWTYEDDEGLWTKFWDSSQLRISWKNPLVLLSLWGTLTWKALVLQSNVSIRFVGNWHRVLAAWPAKPCWTRLMQRRFFVYCPYTKHNTEQVLRCVAWFTQLPIALVRKHIRCQPEWKPTKSNSAVECKTNKCVEWFRTCIQSNIWTKSLCG